ncbi:type I restriction endonuclease subunit R [Fibrobacter sp. UWH4]|uniref:type I restriction endonuclease subunit R n=1 Tax=Fibrobacter sp. UWH4 TaxID=1896210 RepID=UPI0009138418|nr:type I restriction endonuclease [Fibrobacter sp. UWH4]SHK39585.1 type I restriction enzyme, R subunit [Fibrobacter sp. UWH4]
MSTDTSEKGLETLIEKCLLETNGYYRGVPSDYSTDYALDCDKLELFLCSTQEDKVQRTVDFKNPHIRHSFFDRLKNEITKRGVIDVIRKGYNYNTTHFDMYYPFPSELSESGQSYYDRNIFSVTRQVHFSVANPDLSIDMVIFINGMPVITIELKNHYTGQTVLNAVAQYSNPNERNPKELLLQPRRCAVHFAVDDDNIRMCTELKGKESWFLPFDKGVDGGAGNPVNPGGPRTAYLWDYVLTKQTLSYIVENLAQVAKFTDEKGRVVKESVVWPRYHQLDAVRYLVQETKSHELGQKFLIQHSAGSGKSNTITWLAFMLAQQLRGTEKLMDSIIVVTDRVNLDKQIRNNINAYNQLGNIVGWADSSETLRKELTAGKRIIITIVHKFPFILKEIGTALADRRFAIIIDEAHSSQSGSLSAKMNMAIAGVDVENEEDFEDILNKTIEGRKMVKNANYYAFTATPKNKTLEMFGKKIPQPDGKPKFEPHHNYTMRQAIQEGFILDVLKNYTPYQSYYKVVESEIIRKRKENPEFDRDQAQKKIRWYVESRPETVEKKAAIIVNHFINNVINRNKVGGQARAMVVTAGIERAIDYYYAISKQLQDMRSPYKAVVAFSGKKMYHGKEETESSINKFPSADIEKNMKLDPYRILVVADKFQTGYDEPLLHTMYVDKGLTDIKAVQTLSRLNRCHPKKKDTFILDFANDPEDIKESFQRYYKMTTLAGETDPNKLNDLIFELDEFNIYTQAEIDLYCRKYLGSSPREELDPIIDTCVERFKNDLQEEQQIACKSAMKNFVRIYTFLAAIMPFGSEDWEKRWTFYKYLVMKLPKLKREDFTEGLLESIDFDQLRIVEQEAAKISLENENAEIAPVPTGNGAAGKKEPDLVKLSDILEEFNQRYGGVEWEYPDKVKKDIDELPKELAENESFANAVLHADESTVQIEGGDALQQIIVKNMAARSELFRIFLENQEFQNFLVERVINAARTMVRGAAG